MLPEKFGDVAGMVEAGAEREGKGGGRTEVIQ